jgi:integrase
MYFGRPKTSSGEARVVNLDDATAGTLLAHRLAQDVEREQWGAAYVDHDLVFPKEDGTPLHPDSLSGVFERLRAGLRHTRLHDLRHGQASLMLASGADMVLVSKRMGHSSVSTTADLYSHLVGNVGKESAEKSRALVRRSPDAGDQSVTSTEASTESVGQGPGIRPGQERV